MVSYRKLLIGHETINIPEMFSDVHGYGKDCNESIYHHDFKINFRNMDYFFDRDTCKLQKGS